MSRKPAAFYQSLASLCSCPSPCTCQGPTLHRGLHGHSAITATLPKISSVLGNASLAGKSVSEARPPPADDACRRRGAAAAPRHGSMQAILGFSSAAAQPSLQLLSGFHKRFMASF